MRASIRQVAEIAQVSPMTVTRVLRGRDLVAEETRKRVLDAVRQTNYVPVRSAMQNRHVSTNILGLVPYHSDMMRNRIDSETYEGVCRAARRNGYDLLVMLRDESEWMADRAEVRFLDRRSDGFLFVSTGCGEWWGVLETLSRTRMALVVCYRRDVPEGVAWIDPDNDAIIRRTVGLMACQGHRRIAYLTTRDFSLDAPGHLARETAVGGNFDDRMRRAAFERIAAELGCEAVVIEDAHGDWTLDEATLHTIRARAITGVVCVNDHLALQLWDLAVKVGLRIPEDLSLTGVDDMAEGRERGLTSVAFGYDTVGDTAVESWVRLLRGEPAAACCQIVPVELRERKSVSRPPAGSPA